MTGYVVVRLLDTFGTFFPRPQCYGDVEFRPASHDSPEEASATSASRAKCNEAAEPDLSMRAVTIVMADDLGEAQRIAAERITEALDVLEFTDTGLSRHKLLESGYLRSLANGWVQPRNPDLRFGPFPRFMIASEQFPAITSPQFLLRRKDTDLAQRLLRSLHWSRRARLEPDIQLRVLFRWFSMEAIWMTKRDEDISPRVRWALGFPNGKGLRFLAPSDSLERTAVPGYSVQSKRVELAVTEIHKFRHASVHNGFREQDVPPDRLQEHELITAMAYKRVQGQAEVGILNGLTTAQELMEYLPLSLSTVADLRNVLAALTGEMQLPRLGV